MWGTDCGGADCSNIVWGTVDLADNIVWGTALASDNIVWGTALADNIVWGTATADDNIVWGTASNMNMLPGFVDGATQSAAGAFDSLTDEQVLALAALKVTVEVPAVNVPLVRVQLPVTVMVEALSFSVPPLMVTSALAVKL